MILSTKVAQGIADGTITIVFRRWARARVRAGDTLRTTAGVIAIESVEVIDPAAITDKDVAEALASVASVQGPSEYPIFGIRVRWVGPDPRIALSHEDDLSEAQIGEIGERLAQLDRRSAQGAWTHRLLCLIAANPGLRAQDLAATVGRDKTALKRDIRKLKSIGLTHSLDIGYRISPRGQAYLAAQAAEEATPR